jgi:hypothetical protein
LRAKLLKYDVTRKGKQLEIENVRTERARIDAEARQSKDEKRIRKIAAAHESKINFLLHEHSTKLKGQDKIDREKAKVDAATKK